MSQNPYLTGRGRYGTSHPLDIELERLLSEEWEDTDPKWWELRKSWRALRMKVLVLIQGNNE